jgi:hypothetical protein
MTARTLRLFALTLGSCLAISPAWGDAPTVTTGWATHWDTSPPLRDFVIREAAPRGFSAEVAISIRPGDARDPRGAEPDGGVQETMFFPSAAPTPGVLVSAPGLSDDDNAVVVGGRIVPPDTNGDIGLDGSGNKIYIQYINLIWAVYDASDGSLVDGPFAGNSFWQGFGGFCQANNDGDPVVLYDDRAGRWFFSQFSIDQGIQCVAVSTTGDPLGPYHRYAFTVTPGGNNDYPKLGVWDDGTGNSSGQSGYTFTLRDFGGAGGSFSVSAGVLERDRILAGEAAQFVKFSNPCTGADCIEGQLPPHLAGPTVPAGTCPTFWAAVDSAYDDSPWPGDGYRNHTLCVNWGNVGASTYSEGPIVNAGSNFDRFLGNGFNDCISPLPNPGEVLDCLAAFTMYRVQYRWFGNQASVVLNTTVDAGSDRAGIRWAEVRSNDGETAWFLHQDGTYAPSDGIERWMGSIAQDQDRNIALGYSAASGSLAPSVRYTSRSAADPPGQMPGGEIVCHNGTGVQQASANRWGDYSSMSVDPVDDCTFWFTQEYYSTSGSFDFNTRICSFRFADCGGGCTPTEPTEVTCDDGLDNDCDGAIDCSDTDCQGLPICAPPACNNNGVCELGEDCGTCPSDCIGGTISGAVCGNGVCEIGDGEDCLSCAADCNGVQSGKPSNRFCCGGGQGEIGCADPRCTAGGLECTETGGGGTYCCGDGVCEGPETALNCEIDCAGEPFCGNNVIDPGEVCDGTALAGETCESQGCTGGTLGCQNDCTEFDLSLCTGCSTCVPTHEKEKGPRCSDGLDNDCDGLIDGADPDC